MNSIRNQLALSTSMSSRSFLILLGELKRQKKFQSLFLRLFPTKSILFQMMREVDIDGNGRIDDVEFIQFARTLLNDRRQHPKTELEDALKVGLV